MREQVTPALDSIVETLNKEFGGRGFVLRRLPHEWSAGHEQVRLAVTAPEQHEWLAFAWIRLSPTRLAIGVASSMTEWVPEPRSFYVDELLKGLDEYVGELAVFASALQRAVSSGAPLPLERDGQGDRQENRFGERGLSALRIRH